MKSNKDITTSKQYNCNYLRVRSQIVFPRLSHLSNSFQMSLVDKINQMKRICEIEDEETSTAVTESVVTMKRGKDMDTDVTEGDVSESILTSVKQERQDQIINIIEQPHHLVGGIMKSYQLESLQWMMNIHARSIKYQRYFQESYNHQINAILADEMGLGKTIQALALFAAIQENYGIRGRHLIVVPKSTIPQWQQECAKWLPSFKILTIVGDGAERQQQIQLIYMNRHDIILTTYDCLRIEQAQMLKHEYQYMILDEGHKLKDTESQISQTVKHIKALHKIILTGTPIQNNLNELWSLLNSLMPYIFSNPEEFVSTLQNNVQQLQSILSLFLLRREKKEVETLPPKHEYLIRCPMTKLQKKLYKSILMKDLEELNKAVKSKSQDTNRVSLVNILMQLRKVSDHPYLLKGVEPQPYQEGDHLINCCGKMMVLDRLIKKIKSRNEKVLCFCQFTSMMSIIEDFFRYRGVRYLRIDGSTELHNRSQYMKMFMKADSDITVFLLSTRAGCLGLNLTAANHVIIFQQDFNPQVDQQAVARAYRLLQRNDVYVYRLLCEDSVDVKIYERACIKMKLDELVIQSGNFTGQQLLDTVKNTKTNKTGLMDIINFQTDALFNKTGDNDQETEEAWDYNKPEFEFQGEQLDKLLEQAQIFQENTYKKAETQKEKAESVLTKLTVDGKLDGFDTRDLYTFEGETYAQSNLQKVARELYDRKMAEYANKPSRFKLEDAEEEVYDKRWYPTVNKFRKSSYFRADFYLLNERFYDLQRRVMQEIGRVIEPLFGRNTTLEYDAYVKQIQEEDPATYITKYTNIQLPGLTDEEANDYIKYLEQKCPYLGGQELTKKDFQNFITCLADYDVSAYPEYTGVRKIQYADLLEQKKIENPVLGENLFPYEMLNKQEFNVLAAKDVDISGNEDFELAYMYYKQVYGKNGVVGFNEDDFSTYCRQLLKRLSDLDEGPRLEVRFEKARFRRAQYFIKIKALREWIEKADDPLVNMKIPAFPQVRKCYSTFQDRFLLFSVDCFGYGKWSEILTLIRVSPVFCMDWWFKSRNEEEIARRADKLLKVIMKQLGYDKQEMLDD